MFIGWTVFSDLPLILLAVSRIFLFLSNNKKSCVLYFSQSKEIPLVLAIFDGYFY